MVRTLAHALHAIGRGRRQGQGVCAHAVVLHRERQGTVPHGYGHPQLAGLGMAASSLLVMLNAQRAGS
jgi:cation transport ATPase